MQVFNQTLFPDGTFSDTSSIPAMQIMTTSVQ